MKSGTLTWLILGVIGLLLVTRTSAAQQGAILQTNYKLPITQHSDGHYYDANGVFVS